MYVYFINIDIISLSTRRFSAFHFRDTLENTLFIDKIALKFPSYVVESLINLTKKIFEFLHEKRKHGSR